MSITEVIVESEWNPSNVEWQRGRRVIARTTDGKLHMVYNDQGASDVDIFYRVSDNDGVSWGGAALLSQGDSDPCRFPSIVADEDDELHVAWEHDTGPGEISYRRWNGSSWDSIVTVDYGQTALDQADISDDYYGNQHVIYQRTVNGNRYLTEKVRSSGAFGPRIDIQESSTPTKNQPHGISRISEFEHWCFWQHPPSAWRNIYSNTFVTGSWGTAAIVEAGSTNHLQNARASIDSDGYIHLVYSSLESPTVIKYKKYTGSWSGEATAFSNGSYSRQRSAIAVNAIDEVDIFCEGVQATGRNIVHKHSADGTPSFGDEEALTTGTDVRQWPSAWCRNRYGAQDKAAAGYALAFQAVNVHDIIFGYSDDFEMPSTGNFYEKFVSAGIGISASITKGVTKVADAGVGVSASVKKSVTKPVAAAIEVTAVAIKNVTKRVAARVEIVATHTKAITKQVAAAIGITAAVRAGRLFFINVAANISIAASHTKAITKQVGAGIEIVATHTKGVTKKVGAAIVIVATVTKGITKRVGAAIGITAIANATKTVLINVAANISVATSHTKNIIKQAGANISVAGTVTKSIVLKVSAGIGVAAVATKVFTKQVSASIGVSTSIIKNITKAAAANISVTATVVPTIIGRIVTYPLRVAMRAYNRLHVALSRPDAIHVKMEALDRLSVDMQQGGT